MRRWKQLCAILTLSLGSCTHSVIIDPCAQNRERRAGETVVRYHGRSTEALVFVQGPIGTNMDTAPFFWPERVAVDEFFGSHDIYVVATEPRGGQCPSMTQATAAIRSLLEHRLNQYRSVIVIAHDMHHLIATERAIDSLTTEQRTRIRRVFLFNTPAADRILRSLPPACQQAPGDAPSSAGELDPARTVCSTFDRKRLAGVPIAARHCDTVLLAEMPPDIDPTIPCADALYAVFRQGLAGTIDDSR